VKDQGDIEAYLHSRLAVRHLGRKESLVHYSCPLCGDNKMRGWVDVEKGTAGCWNTGCVANERLPGGAIELIRQIEGFTTKGVARLFLSREFPAEAPTVIKPDPTWKDAGYADWCRLPSMRPLRLECKEHLVPVTAKWFIKFAERQWGVNLTDLDWANAGYCIKGKYAWRIVFPIMMNGLVVAFQARSIRGAEPKYLGSRRGFQEDPKAECGRPAEACLYNYDEVVPGCVALMTEGVGDVLRARRNAPWRMVPFGLLGTTLTQEKLELLMMKKPAQVVVALDNEPETRQRAITYINRLVTYGQGVSVQLGQWVGGKDAGTGATLKRWPMDRELDRNKLLLRMGKL